MSAGKKICKWCGSVFEARYSDTQFCSTKCKRQSDGNDGITYREFLDRYGVIEVMPDGTFRKVCQWCGSHFTTRNITQRNCSSLCGKYLAKHGGVSKAEWKRQVTERSISRLDETRKCRFCGRSYTIGGGNGATPSFCCEACAKAAYKSASAAVKRRKADRVLEDRGIVRLGKGRFRKTCATCGKEFVAHDVHVKFCSPSCRPSEVRKANAFEIRECVWCGREFQTRKSSGTRFCSIYCRRLHSNNPGTTEAEFLKGKGILKTGFRQFKKTCPWCGREFTVNDLHAIYCSESCQKDAGHHRSYADRKQFLEKHGHTADTFVKRGFYKKTCQWCGKEFVSENILQRNCCPGCGKYLARHGGLSRAEWRAKVVARWEALRKQVRQCAYCGKEFVHSGLTLKMGNSVNRRFCSDSCNGAFHRDGCSKIEHERRMAARTIAVKTWSPYLNGTTVTRLMKERVCRWCGGTFVGSYNSTFCCDLHRMRFYAHGGISSEEAAARRVRLCAWCGTAFISSNDNQFCCCSNCSHERAIWKTTLLAHKRDIFFGPTTCSVCGNTFVRDGTVTRICPECKARAVSQRRIAVLFGETVCRSCGKAFTRKGRIEYFCPYCKHKSDDDRRRHEEMVRKRTSVRAKDSASSDMVLRAAIERARAEYDDSLFCDAICTRCGSKFPVWSTMHRICTTCRFEERMSDTTTRGYLTAYDRMVKADHDRHVVRLHELLDAFDPMPEIVVPTVRVANDENGPVHLNADDIAALIDFRFQDYAKPDAMRDEMVRMVVERARKQAEYERTFLHEMRPAEEDARIVDAVLASLRPGYEKVYDRIRRHEADVAMQQIRADELRERQEFYERFFGTRHCQLCGIEFMHGGTPRRLCDSCKEFSALLSKERDHKRYVENRDEILKKARERHLANRDEINRRSRERYWKNRDSILARNRSRHYGMTIELAYRMREAERAESEAVENKIAQERAKFHRVEMALLLPPEERWQFAKDWTDEERAYAARVSAVKYGSGIALTDDDNTDIGIEDLSEGYI